MGCWNGTCGISGLSISYGTPTYVLPVTGQIDTASMTVEPSYIPFGFLIEGTYDDYGTIENIREDWKTDYLKESIQNIGTFAEDCTDPLDKFVLNALATKSIFSKLRPEVRDILQVLERGIARDRVHRIPIGFWMARKDVADFLISQPIYHYITGNEIDSQQEITQLYDLYSNIYLDQNIETENTENQNEDFKKNQFWKDMSFEVETNELFGSKFFFGNMGGFAHKRILRDFLDSTYNETTREKIVSSSNQLLRLVCNMRTLRKDFSPSPGAGSQEENHELYKKLYGYLSNI